MARKVWRRRSGLVSGLIALGVVSCNGHVHTQEPFPKLEGVTEPLVQSCAVTSDGKRVICERKSFVRAGLKILELEKFYQKLLGAYEDIKENHGLDLDDWRNRLADSEQDRDRAENLKWVWGSVGFVGGCILSGLAVWGLAK